MKSVLQSELFVLTLWFVFSPIEHTYGLTVEEELTLTRDEKRELDKFKMYVENELNVTQSYMKTDIYLIKWLRVAKLDTFRGSAQDLFKEHLKWRVENKIDDILSEDFSKLRESLYPIFLEGEDKTGRPVLAADASQWDVRGAVLAGLKEKAVRLIYYSIELQLKKIRDKQALGQNVTQMIAILDLSGYSIVQHGCLNCISIYVDFIRSFIFRYPYMTDSLIFVNTPPIFEIILDTLNLRKARIVTVKVFGKDKREWRKYLTSRIDDNQLPKFLGGKLDA